MANHMTERRRQATQDIIRKVQKLYDYDPKRGALVDRRTGRVVKGHRRSKDYWSHHIHIGKDDFNIHLHLLIWVWHHGRFPDQQLDHRNGQTRDNRIENLREVTPQENRWNTLFPWQPNPVTGLPGVVYYNGSFKTGIQDKTVHNPDPYWLFYMAVLLGKRYKED